MNLLELAKEHGVVTVLGYGDAMLDHKTKLQSFAQAVIEDYKSGLVPVAYKAKIPNKDGTYHCAFGEIKDSGLGVAWYTPLYEIVIEQINIKLKSAQPTPSQSIDERVEFESEIKKYTVCSQSTFKLSGYTDKKVAFYDNQYTQYAWLGWQARANLSM